MTKPTTIYGDTQIALDVMAAGNITRRVKRMAVHIAIIHKVIKIGNEKGEKISGKFNPADIGTNPLPASTLHRLSRQLRGQGYYTVPDSEHGRVMQVELVHKHINETENNKSNRSINL